MNIAKFPMQKAGQKDDSVNSKIRAAEIALASSPPTDAEAIKETKALASCFSQDLPDDRLNAVVEIFLRYPLLVVRDCTDMWSGIACERIPDLKTGKLGPRRWMPSNSEIKEWLENRLGELTKLVKGVEIAAKKSAETVDFPLPQRTPEDCARVKAKLQEYLDHVRRSSGRQTPEEQRAEAERYLESCREAV